jgi:hypothetical protein
MTAAEQRNPFWVWSQRWLKLADISGREIRDPVARGEQLIALWKEPIPGDWQRKNDSQILDSTIRYRRHHRHGHPAIGSEHELEHKILDPDPQHLRTTCFGGRLIDGINAVPLAHDSHSGRRVGNVEADMLLLTEHDGSFRQLLIEVKTICNTTWYATVESLRQLRLYTASTAAQQIMLMRQPHRLTSPPPVTAVVLAPEAFYAQRGRQADLLKPTIDLIRICTELLNVDIRLATWHKTSRAVVPWKPSTDH